LTRDVNAPLLAFLAEYIGEVDTESLACIPELPPSLPGAPLYDDGTEKCLNRCVESNTELLKSLRNDSREEALHMIAHEDWKKNRMTMPVRAAVADTSHVRSLFL